MHHTIIWCMYKKYPMVQYTQKESKTQGYLVFLWGKTVNSYRRNHDIMGMLPIPLKAVERFSTPRPIPTQVKKCKIRSRLHTPQTSKIATMNSMPPCFCGHALGDGRQGETGIRITRGDIYNVLYVCGGRRRCSASAVRPSLPARNRFDDSSIVDTFLLRLSRP